MEYTQEQIDAMKKLMQAYNALSEEVDTELPEYSDVVTSEVERIGEAIKTLSEPMKDSLEGLSV